MDFEEIIEQLFGAIDAIITERIRTLPIDKTVIATIKNNTDARYGRYQVSTDDNIIFYAYSENINYQINEKVYVRIPENDYTQLKVITGRYIPDNLTTPIK